MFVLANCCPMAEVVDIGSIFPTDNVVGIFMSNVTLHTVIQYVGPVPSGTHSDPLRRQWRLSTAGVTGRCPSSPSGQSWTSLSSFSPRPTSCPGAWGAPSWWPVSAVCWDPPSGDSCHIHYTYIETRKMIAKISYSLFLKEKKFHSFTDWIVS